MNFFHIKYICKKILSIVKDYTSKTSHGKIYSVIFGRSSSGYCRNFLSYFTYFTFASYSFTAVFIFVVELEFHPPTSNTEKKKKQNGFYEGRTLFTYSVTYVDT